MSLAQIEQEALTLSERDRAALAVALLQTLSTPRSVEISDEEIAERDRDLESGRVEAISHEEFVRRVEQDRRR